MTITTTAYLTQSSAPKPQPKSAANTKPTANTAARGAKGKRGGARGGRAARPAKKTAEELDSEMADYWTGAAEGDATTAGGPAPANADAPMDDEILVGRSPTSQQALS